MHSCSPMARCATSGHWADDGATPPPSTTRARSSAIRRTRTASCVRSCMRADRCMHSPLPEAIRATQTRSTRRESWQACGRSGYLADGTPSSTAAASRPTSAAERATSMACRTSMRSKGSMTRMTSSGAGRRTRVWAAPVSSTAMASCGLGARVQTTLWHQQCGRRRG